MPLNLVLTDATDHFDSTENLSLKRRIMNHLQRRFPNLDSIDVEAHRGTVILRGTVASSSNRWRCLDSCRHVRGVLNVIDRIVLAYCLPEASRPNHSAEQRETENR
jgi:BON domain